MQPRITNKKTNHSIYDNDGEKVMNFNLLRNKKVIFDCQQFMLDTMLPQLIMSMGFDTFFQRKSVLVSWLYQ